MKRIYPPYLFLIVLLIACFSSNEVNGEIVTRTVALYPERYRDKDSPKKPEETFTETSIIYTTIIYITTSSNSLPTPTVYGVSYTHPGHQEQTPQTTNTDPNGQSLQESLQDDQQALKRMIMILSLVGGLGAIAVVATIVIVTRMRAKNRKQREIDDGNDDGLTSDESLIPSNNTNQDDNNNNIVIHSASSLTSSSVNSSDNRQYMEPSAPPALIAEDLMSNRRNLTSMSSQTTAPSPSAPTAKELDAMIDEETLTESSSHYHGNSHPNTCSRCAPLTIDPPELPPPAYTPSAPPHYVLPLEPIITSPSSSTLLPRRHSMGA